MEPKKLNVQLRTDRRKSASGRLRRGGKIPAVVYGHTESLAITVDAREFRNAFKRITENTVVHLTLPEGVHEVLVKDFQQDHLTGRIVHLDFYEFEKGKALRTRVPVHLTGAPVGVKEGGILETLMRDLEVECLPKDLPEVINLDISNLALNHSIHVRDLPLAQGVKSLNSPEQVVCVVAVRKAEEEAKPAAEVAEGEAVEGAAAEGEAAEGAAEEGAAAEGEAAEGGEKRRKGGKDKDKEKQFLSLVVFGLGNPGERYARTRHNVGFQVVDELAGRLGAEPRRRLFRSYVIAKCRHAGLLLVLVKPLTFMNDSGRVVREALRETGGDVPDVLVVCDSLDLAPGSVRFRLRGSAGGHKGLLSISRRLGTDGFMRLLVGIGRPAHKGQVVDYVLDEPHRDEEPLLADAIRRAADAVLLLLTEGASRVMNEYNRREPPA